jgi:hypothetical protein
MGDQAVNIGGRKASQKLADNGHGAVNAHIQALSQVGQAGWDLWCLWSLNGFPDQVANQFGEVVAPAGRHKLARGVPVGGIEPDGAGLAFRWHASV